MDVEGLQSAAAALAELRQDPWFPYPEAVDLLMAFGEAGVPDLAAALGDPETRIREVAARALGASVSKTAVAALERALRDPAASVRRAAAAAIADQPDPRWVGPLAALLASDDTTEQLTAAQVLGQLGETAVPVLAEALERYSGGDPWVPGEIVTALGHSATPAAAVPLLRALRNPLAHVRQAAIEALTELGEPAQPIADALLALAADPDEDDYLRGLAAEAAESLLSA